MVIDGTTEEVSGGGARCADAELLLAQVVSELEELSHMVVGDVAGLRNRAQTALDFAARARARMGGK